MPKEDEIAATQAAFDEFLDSVDAVVTGLANCGGCTLVAVKAGMAALKRGHPTVFVATEHFERLARVLTTEAGFADIRIALPAVSAGRPPGGRDPPDRSRRLSVADHEPGRDSMTVLVEPMEVNLDPRRMSMDALAQGWGDGLPLIPPTEDLVAEYVESGG